MANVLMIGLPIRLGELTRRHALTHSLVGSPMDDIIDQLGGAECVAEITRRTRDSYEAEVCRCRRIVWRAKPRRFFINYKPDVKFCSMSFLISIYIYFVFIIFVYIFMYFVPDKLYIIICVHV